MKSKKQMTFLLGILLALLIGAACSDESNRSEPVATKTDNGTSMAPPAKGAENRDKALVRVVDAMPGNQRLDTFIGDRLEFTNAAYKTVTPYKEVPITKTRFALKPSGQDAEPPIAYSTESISSGDHYTILVLPATDGSTTLRVMADNLALLPEGRASVRIINTSPDSGEIDVFVKNNEKKLFGGVNFQTVTAYNDVVPQTATLEMRPKGKKDVLLTVPDINFDALHHYTIIVTGKAKGAPKLDAIKIDDELVGATPVPPASPIPMK